MTTGRSCGSCSLCCKIMEVVPEVKPDNHAWCRHAGATSGCGGCKIYSQRPDPCRDFHCEWLVNQQIGQHWFPAKSKIVISAKAGPPKTVAFIVDPDYPLRWREEPWFSDIKHMARAGIEGRIGEKWTTIVMIRDQRIPIIGSTRLLRGKTGVNALLLRAKTGVNALP